jgi:hypothetical protein
MATSSMARPTGSSSSPISSRIDEISYSAETPQVLQLAGVQLDRTAHCLMPWMIHDSEMQPSLQAGAVAGMEHNGIEWISVQHLGSYGSRKLRLIHNARAMLLKPWGQYIQQEDRLKELFINDGDFVLHVPPPGMCIPVAGRYFPPGSLQIIVDDDDRQITDEHTTLPSPELVESVPCSGWCKKQHIYVDHGMTEKAVIFFNSSGWPIACRENILNGEDRISVRWWRFNYSRPTEGFYG